MASLTCPFCGSRMQSERTWAQVALSTLAPAPAFPDMATQARCPSCGRLSAASDQRSSLAGHAMGPVVLVVIVIVALGFAVFALWWG